MRVQLHTLRLNGLTTQQLFQIMKLRQDVFFVEEKIIYPDLDDTDEDCIHVFPTTTEGNKEKTISYARVYDDPAEKHAKIGRVATAANYRGRGLGGDVIKRCCQVAQERFKVSDVWLDAQLHAKDFYERLGFQVASEVFMEAGIEHVRMMWRK